MCVLMDIYGVCACVAHRLIFLQANNKENMMSLFIERTDKYFLGVSSLFCCCCNYRSEIIAYIYLFVLVFIEVYSLYSSDYI